ncbi:MAG TPA: response regulator [Thermoanaerobaculia bacterium]|nr:response regulator [Thermoanaerobaculia bacterium]
MIQFLRRKPRVLLLDDDRSMQKLMATLLRRGGLRVDVVDHGHKAIDAIGQVRYDAILLDLMMPHEGGMTVIRHLRENDPEALQRVILVTAAPESVLKTIAADVAGVVRKPFQHDDLVSTVRALTSGQA